MSLFIAFLILFKGNAGVIINNIGNFIVSGNMLVGFIMLLSIFAIYPVIIYNIVSKNNILYKIGNALFCFDAILVFTNLCLGILYDVKFLDMQIADAFSKFIILANGSAIIYIAATICVLLFIHYFVDKEIEQTQNNLLINNIPLFFNGRIERLQYLITKVIFYVLLIAIMIAKQHFSKNSFAFIISGLSISTSSKSLSPVMKTSTFSIK
mgnify:CR=1 FL=1